MVSAPWRFTCSGSQPWNPLHLVGDEAFLLHDDLAMFQHAAAAVTLVACVCAVIKAFVKYLESIFGYAVHVAYCRIPDCAASTPQRLCISSNGAVQSSICAVIRAYKGRQ